MTGTYPKSKTVYLSPPNSDLDDNVFVLEPVGRQTDRSTRIRSAWYALHMRSTVGNLHDPPVARACDSLPRKITLNVQTKKFPTLLQILEEKGCGSSRVVAVLEQDHTNSDNEPEVVAAHFVAIFASSIFCSSNIHPPDIVTWMRGNLLFW